jgi:hypothetical protein
MAWNFKLVNKEDIRNGVWRAIERVNGGGASKGTAANAGVTVSESVGKTVLTFTNVSVATVDATTNGAQGSLSIYNFPEGLIDYRGGVANLTLTKVGAGITATAGIVSSVGSVAAGVDLTLTGTEADFIPSMATTLAAGVGVASGVSVTANSTLMDGTATAKVARLNLVVADAGSSANDAILVNGTITLAWSLIGDK